MEGLYSIEWLDASDELRMIWKEAAMNYFKKPYHNFPGETEENHKNNHQESQLPRLESNLETPEYEARVLTLNHIRNREYFRQRWKWHEHIENSFLFIFTLCRTTGADMKCKSVNVERLTSLQLSQYSD